MSEHQHIQKDLRRKTRQETPRTPDQDEQLTHEVDLPFRHAVLDSRLMTPSRVLYLQRTIGTSGQLAMVFEESDVAGLDLPPARNTRVDSATACRGQACVLTAGDFQLNYTEPNTGKIWVMVFDGFSGSGRYYYRIDP